MTRPMIALIAAAAALAGCSGASDESAAPNLTNEAIGPLETVNATETPLPDVTATPAPLSNATTTTDSAPETGSPDSQTYDDADATGLTSRVDRGGNETAPTQ